MTRIVVLDVESTGKERVTDQIIELCLQLGIGADDETRTWRIRPSIPIHPEATGVHGISAADLVDCLPFGDVVPEFRPLLHAADVIIGYNVSFDLDMLQAEFSRAKLPPLDLAGKLVVDVLRLWHHMEPRTLVAAHEKFCGTAMTDAHRASADVAATARVLAAMLEKFGMAGKEWSEVAAISDPFSGRAAWVGPSSHIQRDASGAVVFGFGKHKGLQVEQADGGFLRWVLAKDFPPHVMDICRVALERRRQFKDWIALYYPAPLTAQEEKALTALEEKHDSAQTEFPMQEAWP